MNPSLIGTTRCAVTSWRLNFVELFFCLSTTPQRLRRPATSVSARGEYLDQILRAAVRIQACSSGLSTGCIKIRIAELSGIFLDHSLSARFGLQPPESPHRLPSRTTNRPGRGILSRGPALTNWFARPRTRANTLPVGLLRLDSTVLLVDEELAWLVAPRQFLGVGHCLSLGLVDARRSTGSLDLYLPSSVGVGRHDVGLPLAHPLGSPSFGLQVLITAHRPGSLHQPADGLVQRISATAALPPTHFLSLLSSVGWLPL